MSHTLPNPATILEVSRTVHGSRAKAFDAWTKPEQLKQWFAVAEGYTTPIAEVDLKVGGRYRLGMKAPGDQPLLIVGGVYREIRPPERLVFTWRWESADADEPETLVTVEFHERDGATEVVLRHELFTDTAQRDRHGAGWTGCLDRLERLLDR